MPEYQPMPPEEIEGYIANNRRNYTTQRARIRRTIRRLTENGSAQWRIELLRKMLKQSKKMYCLMHNTWMDAVDAFAADEIMQRLLPHDASIAHRAVLLSALEQLPVKARRQALQAARKLTPNVPYYPLQWSVQIKEWMTNYVPPTPPSVWEHILAE